MNVWQTSILIARLRDNKGSHSDACLELIIIEGVRGNFLNWLKFCESQF
jgi:hypothetical protein